LELQTLTSRPVGSWGGYFGFGLLHCSKYALQIEFRHIDDTGVQWVNVAKSTSESDNGLFEQQAAALKATFE
ncbi:hypothetical protein AB6D15_18725, partial [Vibrio splendidus]